MNQYASKKHTGKEMIIGIGGIFLATFFCSICSTGMVLGQAPHFAPNGLGGGPQPLSPAQKARAEKRLQLDQSARTALDTGDFAAAEEEARQSVALGIGSGLGQKILAQALNDQGKDQEALQVYKEIIVDEGDRDQDNLVPYASLLLKSGQWAQALAVYNWVLPVIGNGEMLMASNHFSADVPQPKELASALHIAQGLIYQESEGWGFHLRKEEGMREFDKAWQLAPGAALTNYYYGYGWQHLDPKSKTRVADAPRAKVALTKAAASEDSNVKKAAEEALRSME